MGIRPEEVIQALSALTIQEPHRAKFEESFSTLSPITEERPKFPLEQASVSLGTGESESEKGEGEGERGSALSWDADDITEVTFSRNRSTSKATASGVVSMATTSSIDADSYSGPPSTSDDITDSDNPVFSPDLEVRTLSKPRPLSSSGGGVTRTSWSDSGTNHHSSGMGLDTQSSSPPHTVGVILSDSGTKPDVSGMGPGLGMEHRPSHHEASTTVATSSTSPCNFQKQRDSSASSHPVTATTDSSIDGKTVDLSLKQPLNSSSIHTRCSLDQENIKEGEGGAGCLLRGDLPCGEGCLVLTQEGIDGWESGAVVLTSSSPSLGLQQVGEGEGEEEEGEGEEGKEGGEREEGRGEVEGVS